MDQPISKITNLCYIVNEKNQLLLIMKKRGFGEGKWNAPGGKVHNGEDCFTAICREVEEEVGLIPIEPKEQGFIEFIWGTKPEWNQRCFLYYTKNFYGALRESEEALPQWFEKDKIPFDQMWGDDTYWLKEFLKGKETRMRFFFDKDNKIEKFENIN